MLGQGYYLLRSRSDGRYLLAQPDEQRQFLLMFTADHAALSYLNAHAPELTPQFAVESVSQTQLKTLMDRWGFAGMAMVNDPLVPDIDFLRRQTGLP